MFFRSSELAGEDYMAFYGGVEDPSVNKPQAPEITAGLKFEAWAWGL
jgi:hypothetical protein